LTFGARQGSFPGMLEKHTFNVIMVGEGHGVGIGDSAGQARQIIYKGDRVVVKP
jgi:alpha-D-xyloside xylohydrolase